MRQVWISKYERKDFKPLKHSCVCEKHFVASDFEKSPSLAASVGYTKCFRLRLKPDAIRNCNYRPQKQKSD